MKNLPTALLAASGFALSMISFAFLDETVFHAARATSDQSREIWLIITDLGNSGWMAIVLIATWILSAIMKRVSPANPQWNLLSRQSVFVFIAVALPGVFTMAAKAIVGRARPYLFETEGPFGFAPFILESNYASWPSGHTTTAFAFAVALVLIFPRAIYVALPLAVLAGYSRMAVDAHYLADVIMGATIGTVGAILIYRWLAPKFKL